MALSDILQSKKNNSIDLIHEKRKNEAIKAKEEIKKYEEIEHFNNIIMKRDKLKEKNNPDIIMWVIKSSLKNYANNSKNIKKDSNLDKSITDFNKMFAGGNK